MAFKVGWRQNWRRIEEDMGKHRAFLKRRQTKRLIDPQEGARIAHVLDGPAWTNAWPRLDDWFKPGAFFLGGFLDGRRVVVI